MAKWNFKALYDAAKLNNFDELEMILRTQEIDVDARDENQRTALHFAAERNKENSHYESIELLLKMGADVNAQDDNEDTPLNLATGSSGTKTLELLIRNGADLKLKDNDGRNPLFNAIIGVNFKSVKLLLDYGVSVDDQDNENYTPLAIASKTNQNESHLKICEKLLKKGADVLCQDINNRTPLHHLVERANVKMVRLFLKFKADVNAKDDFFENPLYRTLKGDNVEVFKLLLDSGSDVETINKDNLTLLHTGCKSGCSLEIIESLLKKGLDTNALDKYGRTPLMVFVSTLQKNQNILYILLEFTDVNILDSKGNNIVLFHCSQQTWKMVLKHLAKMKALNIYLDPSILENISKNESGRIYFDNCIEELTEAKSTRLRGCWITFFNLLVGSEKELKNYAGNREVFRELGQGDGFYDRFTIYGSFMLTNVRKGAETRRLFDAASVQINEVFPIFKNNHLILKDILDTLLPIGYDLFLNNGNPHQRSHNN